MTMGNAAKTFETSTNRSDRQLFIGLPTPRGDDSGPMTANVDSGSDFEGRIVGSTKVNKHLQRYTNFLPAQELRFCHFDSFGPGGPNGVIVPSGMKRAMVLGTTTVYERGRLALRQERSRLALSKETLLWRVAPLRRSMDLRTAHRVLAPWRRGRRTGHGLGDCFVRRSEPGVLRMDCCRVRRNGDPDPGTKKRNLGHPQREESQDPHT